jgi:hypothetical protein
MTMGEVVNGRLGSSGCRASRSSRLIEGTWKFSNVGERVGSRRGSGDWVVVHVVQTNVPDCGHERRRDWMGETSGEVGGCLQCGRQACTFWSLELSQKRRRRKLARYREMVPLYWGKALAQGGSSLKDGLGAGAPDRGRSLLVNPLVEEEDPVDSAWSRFSTMISEKKMLRYAGEHVGGRALGVVA